MSKDFILQLIPKTDNNPPTVGDVTITASNITQDSFDLSWNLATDAETDDGTIYYILYESTSSNIGSIADMKANGTIVDEGFQLNNASITGKSGDTTYYHNVLARDANGNELGYTEKATTTATQTSGLDSRAGDEATLEALYTSLNQPALTGWGSNMSLSDSIDGVTVDSIGGELRVIEIDLRQRGLGGNIEIDNWGNLKQCTLINLGFNSINSQIPQGLIDLVESSLVYLYLLYSDNQDNEFPGSHPHEARQTGGGDIHPGKFKGSDNNRWTGAVPAPSNPANSVLEWFFLSWTDSANDVADGISSVPSEFFDQPNMVGFQMYHNNNVANIPFPAGIVNMTNLGYFAQGGRPQQFDDNGWFTGSVPAGFGQLANLSHLRLSNNTSLVLDFNVCDFSGATSMTLFSVGDLQTTSPLPSSFFDGSNQNINAIIMSGPTGPGIGGAHPEVAAGLDIEIYHYNFNSLTSLPASLWQNSPGIIQPNFWDNELTTIGTNNLTNQDSLRYLRLGGNNLHEDWPVLDWATIGDLDVVSFEENRYVFKHWLYIPDGENQTILEFYQDMASAAGTSVNYGNQKSFGQGNSYTVGGDITIDDFDSVVGSGGHADNQFQWYRDGSPLSDGGSISGATTAILTITGSSASDTGTYQLRVTNTLDASIGNGLTLTSQNISVEE